VPQAIEYLLSEHKTLNSNPSPTKKKKKKKVELFRDFLKVTIMLYTVACPSKLRRRYSFPKQKGI
jgi:hypothetical protein